MKRDDVERALLNAGIGPANAVKIIALRYEDYVTAYGEDSSLCGKEKLMLAQAAYYLEGILSVKIEGIVLTLRLDFLSKFVLPASEFYP